MLPLPVVSVSGETGGSTCRLCGEAYVCHSGGEILLSVRGDLLGEGEDAEECVDLFWVSVLEVEAGLVEILIHPLFLPD